ncbi:ATP-binding protein [Streptomyces sp. NPDC101151]|uniref:ATP-binding protein n=1 Tax=Streptomyces sp. NPDC101151 TaxID=3366115 RepID=UPI00381C2B2C
MAQELLMRWGVADEVADSVLLTVSELVSNAVRHAQPPLTLGLATTPPPGTCMSRCRTEGPQPMNGQPGSPRTNTAAG